VGSLSTEFLVLVLLVLANGILATAETAVVSARRTRLAQLAKKSVRAARALALVEQPTRFLSLVNFWLTLSAVIAGALYGRGLSRGLALRIARFPALSGCSVPIAAGAVVLGLSVFLVAFGELIPKRIALAHPEKVLVALAGPLRLPTVLAAPLLTVFGWITDASVRLLRLRPRPAAEAVGEDEVRALVEQGLHAGVFQRAEKEMVEGVLTLDELPVTALMTPRPKIVFLNIDDPEEANWRKIVTSGHSYFPVYQGSRDQVVGMVAVKSLWAHSAIGLPTTLKNLLVPPLLVPETLTTIQLLERFKQSGRHIAIVADEFGAVQGLVTLIDVLEEIVGDLPEPGRQGQPEAKRRDDGSWMIDATLPADELRTLLGIEAPLPDEKDAEYKTVGGFVVTQFGRIPAAGERFEWAGWTFEVAAMDRRRVDKVVASRGAAPAPA
jgi:putative hemolysin